MQNRILLPFTLLLASAVLCGCETTGSPGPQAAAAPATHQQAALDCWMGTERLARSMSLEKRADVVNKCIEEKMKGQPTPMLAEAKPATQVKPAAANPPAAASPAAAPPPSGVRAGSQPKP